MVKKISLEKNIKRIEEIVELLENSDVDIDKALKLFEEGINISHKCHQRLEELENRVRLLTKDADGKITEVGMEQA